MIDVVMILQHWHAGRSKSQIAASLGVDRKTVRKYTGRAEEAGFAPGGPVLARETWAAFVADWFPELVDARARSLTRPELERHRDLIGEMLGSVTATTAWQRLRDEHGLDVGLTSFRRYARDEFPDKTAESQVTVCRPEVEPGSEAQIDWGELGRWHDPRAGRARKVHAFVMVLAASRHMFVRPCLAMNQAEWTACHVAAFEFFNGVPARLVPDNLRTGVDRPDLYDPKMNRTYSELAAYYGCLIDPARAGRPKDKGRVERPMRYIRDSFWAGRDWPSVDAMRHAAVAWCREVAGARQCRPLGGAAPFQVFVAVEAGCLTPLPPARFEAAVWSTPKVSADSHVHVAGTLYSVPYRLIGRRVDARLTEASLEIHVDGQLVKRHSRGVKGRRVTDWNDYPPDKTAFYRHGPQWCVDRANDIGAHTAMLVQDLLAVNTLARLRSAQRIVGLTERHDPARVDAACRRAVEVGDPTYRTVKGILAAGTETVADDIPALATGPAHLHGADLLFAHVDSGTAATPAAMS